MGEFLRTYEPPRFSLNATVNYFLARPTRMVYASVILMEVQFPDVSFWQGEIDYDVMGAKTKAIILRIGQNEWVDSQFERNYREAKRKGLLVGGYWFFDGRKSPQEQANVLISAVRGKKFELEIFMDWEHNYGGQHEGLRNIVAMMQLVEQEGLDIKGVGFYTGYYWFRANSNPVINASQYNYLKTKTLWLAWYTADSVNVLIPPPWTDLTIWQWGTPMVDWGQESLEIDMNFYNGTKAEFEHIYGSAGEPTEPGEPMSDYIKLEPNVAGEYRSVRAQTTYPRPPHIMGTKIGQINQGSFGEALPTDFYTYTEDVVVSGEVLARAGDIWWKLYRANGTEIAGWAAEKHLGRIYLNKTIVTDTSPAEHHLIEVYVDGVLEYRKEF